MIPRRGFRWWRRGVCGCCFAQGRDCVAWRLLDKILYSKRGFDFLAFDVDDHGNALSRYQGTGAEKGAEA